MRAFVSSPHLNDGKLMLGNDHHANHEDVLGQHGGIFAVRGLCKTGKPCPVQGYCHKDTKHVSEIPKCQYKGHISEQWYNGKVGNAVSAQGESRMFKTGQFKKVGDGGN